MLRGRNHVTAADVHDLAHDVLRHRLVLSYDALADGVRPTTCSTASSTPSRRAGKVAAGVSAA